MAGVASVAEDLVRPHHHRIAPPRLGGGHLHVLAPGAGSEGTLAHEGEEVGYVISGRLRLTLGNEQYELGPGDSFAFRSEIQHRYVNPGTTQTRIIWVSTPSRISRGPV